FADHHRRLPRLGGEPGRSGVVHAEATAETALEQSVVLLARELVIEMVLIRRLPMHAGPPGAAHDDALGAPLSHVDTHALEPEAVARELHGVSQHRVG